MNHRRGFTLLELLIVIGIIAILAVIILVAVDPAKRFAQARNAERASAVNAILNAYLNYVSDHNGDHPINEDTDGNPIVTGLLYEIGTSTNDAICSATTTAGIDHINLNLNLVDEYISKIPIDPYGGSGSSTGYFYIRSANNRIKIGACEPELGVGIEVQR